MFSLKRPAPEPVLPPRLTKHRRLSLETLRPTRSPPQTLSARWQNLAKDMSSLFFDTVVSLVPGTTALSNESGTSSADEVTPTSSSSAPSSSMVSTPQQTPSPTKGSGKDPKPDEQSTPTQSFDNSLPSPPRLWTPHEHTLTNESFQILEQAHFSTPKAPLTSFSSSSRTSDDTPSLDSLMKTSILPGIQGLDLDDSFKSSQTHKSFNSSPTHNASLPPPSNLAGNPKYRTKLGHPQPRPSRKHILEAAHKRRVDLERRKAQKEFRERYKLVKQKGFQSSAADFKEYLDYQLAIKDHVTPINLKPNTALFGTKMKNEEEDPVEFLKRALERGLSTMNEPRAPIPNLPNFEKLAERRRAKDRDIETSLRPPPLPESLSPEEDKQVNALLHKTGVVAKFAREQVSHQDIARLQPRQWLNDEVINFYGAMILARAEGSKENPGAPSKGKTKKNKAPLNVHYFSSFFWEKYTQEGYEKGRLAKWTKKIDIFSKDAVLLAANHGNAHWTAASINFRLKRIESYDSMAMADEKVCKILRRYLDEEHMNKKKKPFNFEGWQDWHPRTTPQQENGFDCGVFSCQFLESLSRGEEMFNFSQRNMPYLRKRMIWEIGNGKFYDDR